MENVDVSKVRNAYLRSSRRLFFLDYEGTLVPENAGAMDPSTIIGLNECLFQLSSDSSNQVVVISDQTRGVLEDRFDYLSIVLAAERGGFFRSFRSEWDSIYKEPIKWKDKVGRALSTLTQQHKGSFIDVKHFSLTWDHSAIKRIPIEDLRQFRVALRSLARTNDLEVLENERGIEFITPGVNKARFAALWANSHGEFDFILAIGNDEQDEKLFEALGKKYFTIRVAPTSSSSQARYCLDTQHAVLPFLFELSADLKNSN